MKFLITGITFLLFHFSFGQCCNYVLETQDSFGDGWNGGALDITNGGLNIGTYAASGSGTVFTLTLCDGDNIEFIYSSGIYENENSFTLTAPDGTVLYSVASNPPVGSVYSFTVSGCPTCTDGIQNGGETGIDCGGCNCGPCPGNPTPPSPASMNASSNINNLPCGGGPVDLSANASTDVPVLDNNFDDGTPGTGWNVTPAAQFDNPCGPGVSGTHLWMGSATAAPRTLETAPLNMPCGGEICFYFKFTPENSGDVAPCEGADLYNEGVNLQFSTSCGAGWTDIAYFAPNGDLLVSNPNTTAPGASGATNFTTWDQYCFTIPANQGAPDLTFQWYQSGSSGNSFDHWGLDEVTIDAFACDPYYVDWEHVPGSPDASDVTTNVTVTTDFPVIYTNGVNDTIYDTVTVFVDAVQDPIVNITPELCAGDNDASISASVTGGTGPYNWQLFLPNGTTTSISSGSPANFTNLAPGNYTLTITDQAGCSISEPFNIAPGPVCCQVIANGTDLNCNPANAACDGIVTATPSNGVAPYTYQWYSGAGTASPIGGSVTQTLGGMCAGTYTVQVTDATGCIITDQVTIAAPTALSFTATPTPTLCNNSADGTITVIATGGTAPYKYSLNGGAFQVANAFNGLVAGTYSITVEDDAGCSVNQTVIVTEPNTLNLSIDNLNDATCNNPNGSLNLSATGGNAPYTYDLGTVSNTTGNFLGLPSNTYNIIVTDANGCTDNGVVTIVDIAGPSATINTISDISCNGGANGFVIIDASNGAAPYTYALDAGPPQASNTFTNLTANNYTVTVTDNNNCVGTVNLTINQPSQLSYTTTITDASCSGSCDGAIDFAVVGGTAPYQFSTDNGFTFNAANPATGLCAGTYNVVVTDAQGCLANSTETIIEPPGFNLVINANNATCGFDNGNVTFTIGGASGSGYQLDWNNGGFGTTFSFIDLDAGAYPYTVSDGTGCSQSGFVDISDILGAEIQVLSQTPTSCFGFTDGQVTVETIQGTNPINYFLDGVAYGLSNLPAIEGYNWSNVSGGAHLIYIEDANGCQTFQSINIAEPQEITYSTISEDVSCNGGNDAFIQINANGGVGSFTYSIDNGTTQSPVNFFGGLTANSYAVLIEDAGGCQVTGTEVITEPAVLTANANAVDLVCNGDCNGQILFDPAVGGTAPYIYSIDNGTTNSGGTTFNALCAGTYNLQVSDANNCIFSNTIDIVEPTPVSVTASEVPTTCNLPNGEINVVGAGGTAPYSFALDNGAPQSGTNFNGLAPDVYEVLVTDFNGCADSINLAVTSLNVPVVDFLTTSNPLCFGANNGEIEVTASGGVGALTYSIDGINFVTSNLFGGLTAGTYTITVRDINNCIDTETVTLTDPAVLTIDNVAENAADCFNNATGNFSITALGGTLPYQYDLGTGNGFGPTNTANFLNAGTYNFIVEDANGCQVNGTATITEPQVLEFSPANSTTPASCFGTCDGTVTTNVIGGTAPYFYNWSSNIATVNDDNASNVCAGTYSVIVTDINGCQITDNALMVGQPPLVTINSVLTDSVNCFGESSGEIIIDAPNATVFNVTNNNGINLTQNNGVFTGLPVGTYSISVEDANGCRAFSSTTLYEPTPIALTTNSDLIACFQDEISISAVATGGNGIYTFNWSNSATTANTQLIYPTAPEFISVTVSDQYGCTAPAEGFNVTVNPPVSLNPIPDVFICPGDQVTLTGTFNDGLPTYNLQWEHEADTSATTTVSPTVDTQYTLSIRDFCANVDTIIVNVFMNGVPNLSLNGVNNGCADHTVTLSIDDPNGDVGGGCTWDFGDGNTSNQCNNVTHTYVTPGIYDVNFAFTTSAGCVVDTTYTQAIEVYAQPVADFTFNPNNPNVDDPTVDFVNLSQNEDSYIWDFAGLGTSSLENPSFTFPSLQPDDYNVCLTALSTNGNVACSDQICQTITIADAFSMYVPNTFTPDNDSYNPVFLPILSGNDIYEYNLTIFNRWGEVLFESNNQAIGWDGTYGGEPVKDGTYIWRITARETGRIKDVLFTGHVNVIR